MTWLLLLVVMKTLQSVVTELFIRGRKLNILLVFISKSYSQVSKNVRINTTYFFIMKIPDRRELQEIATTYLYDIDFD